MKPFDFEFQGVIPQVYNESLQYGDLVQSIVSYLNTAIDSLNDNTDNVDNLNKSYQSLVNSVNDFKNEIVSSIPTEESINNTIQNLIATGQVNVGVKSIDFMKVTIETSNKVSVPHGNINVLKSIIIPTGWYSNYNVTATFSAAMPTVYFDEDNTVTVERLYAGSDYFTTVTFFIVEFS